MLKSKLIARSLAFLLIIAPMILIQIQSDREIADRALYQRDANRCSEIKRLLYRNLCLSKIADRKESYCRELPSETQAECIENEATSLRNRANENSVHLAYVVLLLELIPLILMTLWSMGITPLKFFKFLPNFLQEVSRAETFAFLRLPIAGVMFFIFHLVWNQLLSYS